jgi:hypothetical protein
MWISRNVVNGVNLFLFCYLITLTTYLCSQCAPNVQIKYFMFNWSVYRLLGLNRCGKRNSPNNDIRTCLFDMLRSWTKNTVWAVNNKKCRKWCKLVSPFLFNNSYDLLGSQWAPNVQFSYVMFDWSIYRLFVLNTGWKPDSLQMMIFVYICSTCIVVELKTRFVTWVTRNDVNFV